MNQITAPPNSYGFGHEFNYAVWPTDSVITLFNVPFNNDYRDIVNFGSQAKFNKWIDSQSDKLTFTNMSYVKYNTAVKLDVPFNAGMRYNYLRVSNPLQPINGDVKRDYYYFILDVKYIAPETTQFILQVDFWQSFGYEVKIQRGYLERGHFGIAAENNFNAQGRDYLSEPEGFDLGAETTLNWYRSEEIMRRDIRLLEENRSSVSKKSFTAYWMIVSTTDLTGNYGTSVKPILRTARGSNVSGVPGGAFVGIVKSSEQLEKLMNALAPYPWVSTGIVGIYAIPSSVRYGVNLTKHTFSSDNPLRDDGIELFKADLYPIDSHEQIKYTFASDWRNNTSVTPIIPDKYRHLKKFFTSPYMWIEITNNDGKSVIIRPEFWDNGNLTLTESATLTHGGAKIIVSPVNYNYYLGWGNSIDGDHDPVNMGNDHMFPRLKGDGAGMRIVYDNLPQTSIVNDMSIMARASSAYSRAQQIQALGWSQDKALAANQLGYDQATAGMNLATGLTDISIGAANAQRDVANQGAVNSAMISGVQSIAGGLSGGGVVGGLSGAVSAGFGALNTANQINTANQSTAISTGAAAASNAAQVANSAFMRDTNKNLADWSARGDYSTAIAAINARVQDMQLTPPGTAGAYGGDSLMFSFDAIRATVAVRTIPANAIGKIGDYWLRYGYAVNRYIEIPDDYMVMTNFTYWKLQETYIESGPMPESVKQIIRGIFEKGVTVHRSPESLSRFNINNNSPVPGIRF